MNANGQVAEPHLRPLSVSDAHIFRLQRTIYDNKHNNLVALMRILKLRKKNGGTKICIYKQDWNLRRVGHM